MELPIQELNVDMISPNAQNMFDADRGGSKIVIIGKPGTGKCLALDTPILMFDFSIKSVQHVQVGDWLRGDDEIPRIVLSLVDDEDDDDLYEILQLPYGESYTVNKHHILCLHHFVEDTIMEITAQELFETQDILLSYGGYKHFLNTQVPPTVLKEIRSEDITEQIFGMRCPYIVRDNTVYLQTVQKPDDPLVYPIAIQPKGRGRYYGFEITENGRFLLGDATVTHNTTLITSLLYEKRMIFPSAMIMSGTEDSNGHYKKIIPSTFVYNRLHEKKIQDFIVRQKIAKRHLSNPWSVLLLDDCTDDPKLFNKPLFQGIFKNGRHWKTLFLISLQYCMDIKPVIRTNVDGVFILRETNLRNRKSLWENYAGVIPDFSMFCSIMDQLTNDYTALYIHNQVQSNRLEDCIFWYRAKPVPSTFRLGSKDYWKFHHTRYDPSYTDPLV